MAFAPDPAMRAALAVLYQAAIDARLMGYEGAERGMSARRTEQLADLMDAIHDIPVLLGRWEDCDESLLIAMLEHYDAKWTPTVRLAETYTSTRSGSAD